MPKVFYTAKSYSGETKSGELDVKNERDLAMQLRSDGFILTSFKQLEDENKKKTDIKILNRFRRISIKDKLMFVRNLSVMISSGMPLSRAIKSISLQTKSKRFSKMLEEIHKDIQEGLSFADGLVKYPGVFNELFVNMIKVGEVSGNLEGVLEILADQLEKEHDLASKVKGALTYPAVILVAMFGIGILMLTYILPKIMNVFKDMDIELPLSTRIVIGISDVLRNHSLLIVGGLIVLTIGLRLFIMTSAGKRMVSFILISLPIISGIVIKINCARFSRIYSSLLKSGVSVVESLKIISHTLSNHYYQVALKDGVDKIQKGIPLSKIVESHPQIFPVILTQMVAVGEETGKTEEVLFKLAEFYEGEISQITKNLSSIIEPVLMIIIGSAVGFFAVSMLQPMYSIMDNIQ